MLIQTFKTGFICKYIYLGITLKKMIVKYAILKKYYFSKMFVTTKVQGQLQHAFHSNPAMW